jgi:2-keto-4-pentenoate hydratase/2-oxohepta-3-ene-1,7-dioic acid hydratase in catechol pathway
MRWATYQTVNSNGVDRIGVVDEDRIYGLDSESSLIELLGDDGARLREAGEEARRAPREVVALSEVRLRPLLHQPPSIRDFSSFLEHYRTSIINLGQEFNEKLLTLPIFYYTNNTNMTGDGDEVSIPGHATNMDYELEIACVIGKAGIDLTPEEAEGHIAGYCILNDWSVRDLLREELGRAPMPAKGKDAGMGLGPFLVTPDEIEDRRKGRGFDLKMTATVNGREYSNNSWATINWSFGEMLSYASRNVWLRPGDVIGGGTVGRGCILELGGTFGRDTYPWLTEGDEVTVEIERLGKMTNRLKRGRQPSPLEPRSMDF